MIPKDTPSPVAAPAATPSGANPSNGPAPNTTPSPTPGLDPGWDEYKRKRDAERGGTGTGPWWADTGSYMVVKSNGSLHPNGTEPLLKIGDIMYWFWQWDQKQVDKLAEKLVKANMLPSINVTRSDVWEVFRKGVLMEAAQAYASNPNKAPTVETVLQSFMKRPVGDASGSENKPKQYTTTNTQVSLSDPTEAASLLSQTLQQRLGRAPTEAEKHSFLAALNAAQRANPTKTTTSYTLDEKTGGYNTTVGETSGGVNAGQVADDFAMKNNRTEYGAYQAATTYFDAMMGALGTPGGI